MHNILLVGAGKMGSTIARFLAYTNDYQVFVTDHDIEKAHPHLKGKAIKNIQLDEIDINNREQMLHYIRNNQIEAVISCLPYYFTTLVAQIAYEAHLHFFDLTEDVQATKKIQSLSHEHAKAFVSQCGLAPGFINIVARHIVDRFAILEELKLRCGALPENSSNPLKYSLSWSTEGLINEYGNSCLVLSNHEISTASPLEEVEEIQIDGLTYEAFNTSGGIGSLLETYQKRVKEMSYKTIRYPGHCEKMRFLMKGLKLNYDRGTLKRILENAVPITKQDVVIVYVSGNGYQDNLLVRESYVKKFYPQKIADIDCTAIQAGTASGACAVIDLVLNQPERYQGYVKQEDFLLQEIEHNRFGKYFVS